MALKKESDLKSILIVVDKDGLNHLKTRGINRSAFMRQAIIALKQDKFIYQYIEEPEDQEE